MQYDRCFLLGPVNPCRGHLHCLPGGHGCPQGGGREGLAAIEPAPKAIGSPNLEIDSHVEHDEREHWYDTCVGKGVITVRFFNLFMDPPSYPKYFFPTGNAVGAWVGMRAHMQAPRCLWKRRSLGTSADPNIDEYFSPPQAEKRYDIGSE